MYKKLFLVMACVISSALFPAKSARNEQGDASIRPIFIGATEWDFRLMDATRNNDASQIKAILSEHGHEISLDLKRRAFLDAAWNGQKDIMKLLLTYSGNDISPEDKGRAFVRAAVNGHKDMMELLLTYSNAEHKGRAFVNAAEYGEKDIIELLFACCANDISSKIKRKAFVTAAEYGQEEIIKLLVGCCDNELSTEAKASALSQALIHDNYQLAELLFSLIDQKSIRQALPHITADLRDSKMYTWLVDKLGAEAVAPYITSAVHQRLLRGDTALAQVLCEHGCRIDRKPIEHLVEAMVMGLQESREIHRFKALVHLMDNAGISLPETLRAYLNSPVVDTESGNFTALYSYVHELAEFYLLNAARYDLASTSTSNVVLYYNIFGRALEMLDNDYALEVLLLNGIVPEQLEHDEIVYRGMKGPFNQKYIESLFEVGHKAYIEREARLFGFSTRASGSHWEYNGTYVSLNPIFSARFAVEWTTARSQDTSLFMEMRLSAGSPKLCGHNIGEWELIVNSIKPSEIKAVYVLDQGLQVTKVYANPYYIMRPGESPIAYKVGDIITPESSQAGIKRYEQLQCAEHQQAYFSSQQLAQAHRQIAQRFTGERKLVGETCRRLNLFDDYTICQVPGERHV